MEIGLKWVKEICYVFYCVQGVKKRLIFSVQATFPKSWIWKMPVVFFCFFCCFFLKWFVFVEGYCK